MRGRSDKLVRNAAISGVLAALDHAETKHEYFPDDPHHQITLMSEELGEASRALNDGRGPDDTRNVAADAWAMAHYRAELQDLAATVIRALIDTDDSPKR